MKDPIAVEARFEADGSLHPLAFEWGGDRFSIQSYGRQWEEDGQHHFLVMTSGDLVFELLYFQEEKKWQLGRRPQDFQKPGLI